MPTENYVKTIQKKEMERIIQKVQSCLEVLQPYNDEDVQRSMEQFMCEGLGTALHCSIAFLEQAEKLIVKKLNT